MPPFTLAPARLRRIAAPFLLLAATATIAQQTITPATDPANLAGERVSAPSLAAPLPINHGAPALAQLLKKLRTRASLMMIVAHPDDEDGGMLTYESRGLGARVAMLTLTRGEGGQNLMTADFNDALGLIRTQELLAADRYLGVDQFFGTVVDFGFSKTPEETLQQWTHNRVLYDTVRAVRLYRPLVLTSTWIGGVTDGHGHHQVSGQMNQEVFNAAADPKVFPEMGLPAWAPLKVYARVPFARIGKDGMFDYATGKSTPPRFYNYVTKQWTTTPPTANVQIPEGTVSNDPGMDGDTYLQFARRGLALQKTQIGGNVRPARAGSYDAPYTRYASRVEAKDKEQSFFDGIDTTLPGIATLAPDATPAIKVVLKVNLGHLDESLKEAQHSFSVEHPEATAPSLQEALRTVDFLISQVENFNPQFIPADQKFNLLHELRIKRVQCNNALVLALGLTFQPHLIANATYSGKLTAGERLNIASGFSAETNPAISKRDAKLVAATGLLKPGLVAQLNSSFSVTIATDPTPTRPYFSRPNLEQPFYTITDTSLRNAPATPAPLIETLSFNYDGAPLEMSAIVQPANPTIPSPALAVPALSIQINPSLGLVPVTAKNGPLTVTAIVRSTIANMSGTVHLELPAKWQAQPASVPLKLANPGDEQSFAFTVSPMGPRTAGQRYSIRAIAETNQGKFNESYRPIGYPGIPPTNAYTPATFKATAVDVTTAPSLKIAYLPGTGDDVAMYLPNLGITPTIITTKDLTQASLAKYDAILLGVRAYAAHPELANSAPLLDYAKSGGVVIVQYNTSRYGTDQSPYPIDVPGDSAHNVVVEAQPVQILAPNSPLLTWPNKITSKDFTGWTEELGHGFATSWDSHFEALTETHDPDQDPQKGGLLYARTGRGAYAYVAYALYRQLPEGVPGAYRIFANLLSLSKNPSAGIQPIAR